MRLYFTKYARQIHLVIQLHGFTGCVCILSILQNFIIHKQLLLAITMNNLFTLVDLLQTLTSLQNMYKIF